MASAERLAQDVSSLFSLPDAAIRVNQLIGDPKARDEDLAEVILHDPGLTAQLLKLVNSAAFGLAGKVDTVSRAITLVGRERLRSLVLATSVAATFKDIPPNLVDMQSFWFRSVNCASIARLIAADLRVLNPESCFVGGLLSGIGRLIFYSRCPDQYQQVLARYIESSDEMIVLERQIMGFDYAELGAELLKCWKLPANLQSMVRRHADAAFSADDPMEDLVVHAATAIASAMDISGGDEDIADKVTLAAAVEERLKLDRPKVGQFIEAAKLQAFDILQIICPAALAIH